MDFILKKKQFRFDVSLKVEELSLVPFVNAVLYCKLRFIGNGKRLIGQTPGLELQDHRVVWNKKFTFPCKMTANSTTMELDATCCRISIRREMKGGRAHHKIGFVDLNLSEYVGSGSVSRRFLLEGYHSSNRLDNSILKLSIGLTLVSGDVCFKVLVGWLAGWLVGCLVWLIVWLVD
ncbi:hypothetical protein HELRODRAFT_66319 [Helobdella robusta]|uniref:C2 NT-type domain-containing protein n=1 Tax=Helobdella robusta TaxID=6412 RepID=T1FYJ7_HELRO|nr:hypothetical protein HELRODRAFT_66319 [Helobdella robusta]ESO02510.1 hypothetical protein HELRODRAFT_66319 [Helobdella robusta]